MSSDPTDLVIPQKWPTIRGLEQATEAEFDVVKKAIFELAGTVSHLATAVAGLSAQMARIETEASVSAQLIAYHKNVLLAHEAAINALTITDPAAPTPVDPEPAPVDPAPAPVDPAPAPVDPAPVDPAPAPEPDPVDPAPVDPAPVDPAPVDPDPVPVTSSEYVLLALNDINEGIGVYRITRKGYRGEGHVVAIREPSWKGTALDDGTVLPADSTSLSLKSVEYDGLSGLVAQGSVRVLHFDYEMCPPQPDRLREAVAKGWVTPYLRERAWVKLDRLARDNRRSRYDPKSLGPRLGTTSTPSSGNNFVGNTSSSPGEHPSSRGFLHNWDAAVLDAAMHHEDDLILSTWDQFVQFTFYSLAQPNGADWSFANNITSDPQKPYKGDRPWALQVGPATRTHIDQMQTVAGWDRDLPHLENTGFIHWLLTGDPLAALLINRQCAYALAGHIENYRPERGPVTQYGVYKSEERGTLNTFSALWKMRCVAWLADGKMPFLWEPLRVQTMVDECAKYIQQWMDSADEVFKLSGSVFGRRSDNFTKNDGTVVSMRAGSDFETVQYGSPMLYLWARAGHPIIGEWFERVVRHFVVRVLHIGGTLGADMGGGGSSYPIGPKDGDVPFEDDIGWARWVVDNFARDISRTTFSGCAVHTAVQIEGLLLLAKSLDADVPELADALTAFEAQKEATDIKAMRYADLMMHKHCAAPPEMWEEMVMDRMAKSESF